MTGMLCRSGGTGGSTGRQFFRKPAIKIKRGMEESRDMIDLQDRGYCPAMEEISAYVRNPVFMGFCSEIKSTYKCNEKIEYSGCSWEKGWNVKFKKAGKSLCTIYPREGYFTVLLVVGKKEKPLVEEILPDCTEELQTIYHQTQEGNGQRWLMVDLEDQGRLYDDLLRLIRIRRNS